MELAPRQHKQQSNTPPSVAKAAFWLHRSIYLSAHLQVHALQLRMHGQSVQKRQHGSGAKQGNMMYTWERTAAKEGGAEASKAEAEFDFSKSG